MSSAKAEIGKQFTISFNYTSGSKDTVNSVELWKQKSDNFLRIVTFAVQSDDVTIFDLSLVNRTITTKPTVNSNTAKLLFLNIECSDEGNYQWKVNYFNSTDSVVNISDFSFPVRVPTAFNSTGVLTYAPNTISIAENTEVSFTCSGDVGSEPTGKLGWYYYLGTDVSNVSDNASLGTPVASDCSNKRTSVLIMKLTKERNNIVVRCTIQQDKPGEFGDGYIQTEKIVVHYKPRINTISKSEPGPYVEGHSSLVLTCTADALPLPSFYWVLPDVNGTVVQGSVYILTNLTVNDTGVYTCTAYNTINGQNYSVNTTTTITVNSKTTTPPTTTTTTSTKVPGTRVAVTPTPAASTNDSKSKTNSIIIGVVVGVGGAIIIVIIIIVILLKRKPKPKIEEPPEKPRNNRPDLVIANNKNFGPGYAPNSSFNNSFDSSSNYKLGNEHAINDYDNLQFDDKPRSRKPIQLLDNSGSSSMFSNVTMPKV